MLQLQNTSNFPCRACSANNYTGVPHEPPPASNGLACFSRRLGEILLAGMRKHLRFTSVVHISMKTTSYSRGSRQIYPEQRDETFLGIINVINPNGHGGRTPPRIGAIESRGIPARHPSQALRPVAGVPSRWYFPSTRPLGGSAPRRSLRLTVYLGQAHRAMSERRSSSSRLAPLMACTVIP